MSLSFIVFSFWFQHLESCKSSVASPARTERYVRAGTPVLQQFYSTSHWAAKL